ncbi:hypothetical protein BaRGS_00012969 [Batillaria attramentaria]|uniref:Uncharacterized protein n=1 Tax=Batillaria attramentaria TaxID=370345 RepID=A0ABD0L858_9CAEN
MEDAVSRESIESSSTGDEYVVVNGEPKLKVTGDFNDIGDAMLSDVNAGDSRLSTSPVSQGESKDLSHVIPSSQSEGFLADELTSPETMGDTSDEPAGQDRGRSTSLPSLPLGDCTVFNGVTYLGCAMVNAPRSEVEIYCNMAVLNSQSHMAIPVVLSDPSTSEGSVSEITKWAVLQRENAFEDSKTDIGEISLAFYSGLFAYNGWNYLNFVIEELKDPYKNLPKAIWISIILVTTVYTLTNIAYFTTVSPNEILSGAAVAVMFSKRLYSFMWWIMPIFVSLSTFGGVNGILFTTARLFYVGGREGHMPQILSMVQVQRLTPLPAVLFMGLLSLVYLASSDIYALINYVGFATWLSIGLAIVSLLYLRYKRPNMPRPIKVHLVWPIIYTLVTIYLVVLPLYASPTETGIGLLIILTGVPVYVIFVVWKSKPKAFYNFMDNMTTFLQKLLVVVPEEKKAQ